MFQLQPKVNHTEVFRDIKKSVKNAVCRFCRYSFVGDAEDQSLPTNPLYSQMNLEMLGSSYV